MSKVVSVIIPTYNREAYIVESVKSVLDQKLPTGFSMEVIVVDDGSTDKTAAKLEPLKNRIKYIKTSNSGRPATPRNLGIKASKGELIAFQDSDDIWVKDKLINQLPDFKDSSVGLSYGKVIELQHDKPIKTASPMTIPNKKPSFESLVQDNFISTLTVIVRRNALDKVGFFDESFDLRGAEDYELWLRVASQYRLAYCDKVLARYRRHDQNISLSIDSEAEAHLYKLFKITRRKKIYSPQQKIIINQRLLALIQIQKISAINSFTFYFYIRLTNKLLRLRTRHK